jgi:hypothetical protein
MQTLILAAIRCSLMFTPVTGSLVCVQPAQAYTVTLQQIGANVVANGSGAINLTHAHHRRGWCARWRLDSFSARFRFARLGCLAAQIGLLSPIC